MANLLFGDMKLLGKSPEIDRIRKAIKAIAKRDDNVLILGEVGTGRSYVAEGIHRSSSRGDKPFIPIQCGAIGDTIEVESVFGSGQGGETEGQLFAAKGGTIYLDGVDRLDSTLQDKLYNFLITFVSQNGSGEKRFQARIIASSEPFLERAARDGEFRLDLFQELNKFRINLPPIRERKQDIPYLFTYFLETFCREFGKPIPTVPYDIFEAILEYDWPGNVAELRNCVRNLVILSPDGDLSPEFLPFRVQRNPLEALATRDLPTAVSEVERFLIRRALARFEGNQTKAARLLQVSEAALRYKMKKYGFPTAR